MNIPSTIDLNATHTVLGFGKSGLSLVKTLKMLGIENIYAMDSRSNPPNEAEIKRLVSNVSTAEFSKDVLEQSDYLWLSPGVALSTPVLKETLARLPSHHVGGDIELLARLLHSLDPLVKIIAITGTNGKSTVTTMVGSVLQTAGIPCYMGGNLGEPALDLWLQYQEDKKRGKINGKEALFLLELSSFQLETTYSLIAEVGALLNLSPDHLDRYSSYQAYKAAKFSLLSQVKKAVIPPDQEIIHACKAVKTPFVTFSLQNDRAVDYCYSEQEKQVIFQQAELTVRKDGSSSESKDFAVKVGETKVGGLHNIQNEVATVAILHQLRIEALAIEKGLKAYTPLPYRTILEGEIAGVRYYNDSKATNIASTIAAIKGFKEPKWLILGGDTKGQDFSVLTVNLDDSIRNILLIGKDVSAILPFIPPMVPSRYVETLDKAVAIAAKQAVKGEVVLFSPACASFDQFENFEVRGACFSSLINKLRQGNRPSLNNS